MLSDSESNLLEVYGVFDADTNEWLFSIPASFTSGLKGRYYYSILIDGVSIITEAIYFNK